MGKVAVDGSSLIGLGQDSVGVLSFVSRSGLVSVVVGSTISSRMGRGVLFCRVMAGVASGVVDWLVPAAGWIGVGGSSHASR